MGTCQKNKEADMNGRYFCLFVFSYLQFFHLTNRLLLVNSGKIVGILQLPDYNPLSQIAIR